MIEKFSEEELKQIKKELGVEKEDTRKRSVCKKEISELNELWKEKPFAKDNCIFHVVDITLCNVQQHQWGSLCGKYGTNPKIIVNAEEYLQMFQEILEIIKKRNRKWGDNQ